MNNSVKRMVFLSMLVATGLALGIVESMIPLPFAAPGARLGLSNIVILVTIVVFGFKEGLIVGTLKSVLLMLATGHVTSFFYSFAGAISSGIAMILAYKYLSTYITLIGVSEIGSMFHNIGQIITAIIMVQNIKMISYLPFLLVLGLFTGYFVGLASNFLVENLRKNFKYIFKE